MKTHQCMIVIANAVVGFDSYRDPGHVTFLNPEFEFKFSRRLT
jgi:hypothetical protein